MNWTLTIPGRPPTVNQFMKWVPHRRSDEKVPWRKAAQKAAQDADVLCTRPVTVTVTPQLRGRRKQDVGACYLVAKACIDGLVDAFAMPDDDDEHLIALTFRPAVYGCDEDSMRLDIEEVPKLVEVEVVEVGATVSEWHGSGLEVAYE